MPRHVVADELAIEFKREPIRKHHLIDKYHLAQHSSELLRRGTASDPLRHRTASELFRRRSASELLRRRSASELLRRRSASELLRRRSAGRRDLATELSSQAGVRHL